MWQIKTITIEIYEKT